VSAEADTASPGVPWSGPPTGAGLDTRLQAAARPSPMGEHAFVRALEAGRLPPARLAEWAHELHALSVGFPSRVAALIAVAPPGPLAAHALENLQEELGVQRLEAGGVRVDPAGGHGLLARRLAVALGAPPVAPPQPAPRSFAQALAAGRWAELAGWLFVGMELSVADTFPRLIAPLRRHAGLDDHALEFLILHQAADALHAARGIELLESAVAAEPSLEAEALRGARRGAVAWRTWLSHAARPVGS
jgi:pyrroloquinoline quinone (PQQ) biosynthesis protein C